MSGILLATACKTPAPPKYGVDLPEFRTTHASGMKIIVLRDDTTDLVEVDVRYEVGGKEDPPGKAGMAHLVEHAMFMQHVGGLSYDESGKPVIDSSKPPIWSIVQQIGVFFNAYTTADSTHYMTMAKKTSLEDMIAMESVRMNYGCKTITEDEFLREREVVKNEIRWRSGTPQAQVQEAIQKAVYPAGHPYRETVGGDDEQLGNISLQDVCDFMDRYYIPERATMIVAGNVTPEEVQSLVAKWFANTLPTCKADEDPAAQACAKRAIGPLSPVPEFEPTKAKHDWEADVEQPSVHVAFVLPSRHSEEGLISGFLFTALGRVAQEAEEWDFATRVQPGFLGGDEAPVLTFNVYLKSADKVDEALDAIWRATNSRTFKFFEGEDLEDTRKTTIADLVMSFEDLNARTRSFGDYAQFDSSGKYFRGELEKINSMHGDQVRSLARRVLDRDKATVVVVKPKAGARTYERDKDKFKASTEGGVRDENLVDPEEAKRPLPVPDRASIVSQARRFELGNGMKVVLLPTDGLPVVTMSLIFNAGSAHEPPSRAGLANVAAGLSPSTNISNIDDFMTKQDEMWSVIQMNRVGIDWGGFATADSTVFSLRGLNIYLDIMIEGAEALIRKGDYDQESLERQAKRFKQYMKLDSSKKQFEFYRRIAEATYGPDHPYATTGSPTLESIENIGRDAAMSFKQKHYSAGNATLVMAGNFDVDKAESLIKSKFGGWSKGHTDTPVATDAYDRKEPYYLAVERGIPTPFADIEMRFPAPAGIDGQFPARLVLAQMLGIEMLKVREELGASYGMRATRETHIGPTSYVISGPVDAERVGEVLKFMKERINVLREGGEEFDKAFALARRRVVKQLLGNPGTSGSLAQQLGTIARYGLPPDHYDKLVRYVGALSPAQVKELARAELRPDLEIIGCLGPLAKCKAGFEAIGVTSPEVIE